MPQAGEKDKEDNMVDALGPDDATAMKNEELNALKNELAIRAGSNQLDGFGYYLWVNLLVLIIAICSKNYWTAVDLGLSFISNKLDTQCYGSTKSIIYSWFHCSIKFCVAIIQSVQ